MKVILSALLFALCISAPAQWAYPQGGRLVVHYFYGRECPHCKLLEPELRSLVRSNARLELRTYEVWYNTQNRALLMRMAGERGHTAKGVPTVIVGREVYLGADIKRVKTMVAGNLK